MNHPLLEHLTAVDENPVEEIVTQIRQLINEGCINPGDRLPPERKLAESFGVCRSTVKTALKKLEFLKIIRTLPQSGSVVMGVESRGLDSLVTEILKLDRCDFFSLVEMRAILETNAVRLASLRHSPEDLERIKVAMKAYEDKLARNEDAIDEDFQFHLALASASKNTVLKSMLQTITPDIMENYRTFNICKSSPSIPISEHRLIVDYIANHDFENAASIMSQHLSGVLNFARNQGEQVLA